MDLDVIKLTVKQAAPCVNEVSATKWHLGAQTGIDCHVLKLRLKESRLASMKIPAQNFMFTLKYGRNMTTTKSHPRKRY